MADEGIPPEGSVELHVGLDFLLPARNPCENDDDSIHLLAFFPSSPTESTAVSPHLYFFFFSEMRGESKEEEGFGGFLNLQKHRFHQTLEFSEP